MRTYLSTHKILVTLTTMAVCGTSVPSVSALALELRQPARTSNSRLQSAVDQIYKNPVLAEQKLKKISSPTAKAYLAFLYFSQKSKFPGEQKKVNSLLNRAIAGIPNIETMPDIEMGPAKCKTMEQMLKYLRWISEADKSGEVDTTNRIFMDYPEACVEAFSAYWYSSREAPLPFALSGSENFALIPAVHKVEDDIYQINGTENQMTNGTMVYGNYRQQDLEKLKASLAPQLFYKKKISAESKKAESEFNDFLKHWADQELYNHRAYAALKADTPKAVAPLAAHYRKLLHLDPTTAHKYAEAALRGYTMAFLGRYSHEQLAQDVSAPIYKAFSAPALSVDALKKRIGQRVMTSAELTEALRLQILNGGNLEIIEWLVKLGAPLNGGTEPPLLTAVDRPDVVAALIKAGADVNQANKIGKTALIQAAQYDDLATIKELIAHKADVNKKMIDSEAAHNLEAKSGDERLYFSYDIGGRTALMYAAGFADAHTTDYLVTKGADKKAKDTEGSPAVKFLTWNKTLSKADRIRLNKELQK